MFKSSLALASASAVLALAFLSPAHAAPDEEAAKALMKANDCTKCHAVDKTKKGPALKKIAAKYKALYLAAIFFSAGPFLVLSTAWHLVQSLAFIRALAASSSGAACAGDRKASASTADALARARDDLNIVELLK